MWIGSILTEMSYETEWNSRGRRSRKKLFSSCFSETLLLSLEALQHSQVRETRKNQWETENPGRRRGGGLRQRLRAGAPTGLRPQAAQGAGRGSVTWSRGAAAQGATTVLQGSSTWPLHWLHHFRILTFLSFSPWIFKRFNWVGMMNANRPTPSPWNTVSEGQYYGYTKELHLKNPQTSEDSYHSIRLKLMLKQTFCSTQRQQRHYFPTEIPESSNKISMSSKEQHVKLTESFNEGHVFGVLRGKKPRVPRKNWADYPS